MPRFLKYLLLCLAVVAVGAAQVVGAQASYFCQCTGQKTVLESCDSACHADAQAAENGAEASAGIDQNDGESLPPAHRHDPVLETLIGTHTPPVLHSPAVIWIAVMTDPFPAIVSCALNTPWPVSFDKNPPERETLPEGVLIARTTVMLV